MARAPETPLGNALTLLHTAQDATDPSLKKRLLAQAQEHWMSERAHTQDSIVDTTYAEILLEQAKLEEQEQAATFFNKARDVLLQERDALVRQDRRDQERYGMSMEADITADLQTLDDLLHTATLGLIQYDTDRRIEWSLIALLRRSYELLAPLEGPLEKPENKALIRQSSKAYFRLHRLWHTTGHRLRRLAQDDRERFYDLADTVSRIDLDEHLTHFDGYPHRRERVKQRIQPFFDADMYRYDNGVALFTAVQDLARDILKASFDPVHQDSYRLYLARCDIELGHAHIDAGMHEVAQEHLDRAKHNLSGLHTAKPKLQRNVLEAQAHLYYNSGRLAKKSRRALANINAAEKCIERLSLGDDLETMIVLGKALDHLGNTLEEWNPSSHIRRRLHRMFGYNRQSYDLNTIIEECYGASTLFLGRALEQQDSIDLRSRLGGTHARRAQRLHRRWKESLLHYALVHAHVQGRPWEEVAEQLSTDLRLPTLEIPKGRKDDTLCGQYLARKALAQLGRARRPYAIEPFRHYQTIANHEEIKHWNEQFKGEFHAAMRNAVDWLDSAHKKDPTYLSPLFLLRRLLERTPDETRDALGLPQEHTLRNKLLYTIRKHGQLRAYRPTKRPGGAIIQQGLVKEVYGLPFSQQEIDIIRHLQREGLDCMADIECHDDELVLVQDYDKSLLDLVQLTDRALKTRKRVSYATEEMVQAEERRDALIEDRIRSAVTTMIHVNDCIHSTCPPASRIFKTPEDYRARAQFTLFESPHVQAEDRAALKDMQAIFEETIASALAEQRRWGYKDMNPGNIGARDVLGDWEGVKPITHYTEDLVSLLEFMYLHEHPFDRGQINEFLSLFHELWNGIRSHKEPRNPQEAQRLEIWAQKRLQQPVSRNQLTIDYHLADIAKKQNMIGHQQYKLRKTLPQLVGDPHTPEWKKSKSIDHWHPEIIQASEWYLQRLQNNLQHALAGPLQDERQLREALQAYLSALSHVRLRYPHPPCTVQAVAT